MLLNKPVPAGEILKDYMGEKPITEVAKELGISRGGLSKILNGHTQITPKMAIMLGVKYETDPMFWLGLSNEYEIWKIKQETKS